MFLKHTPFHPFLRLLNPDSALSWLQSPLCVKVSKTRCSVGFVESQFQRGNSPSLSECLLSSGSCGVVV